MKMSLYSDTKLFELLEKKFAEDTERHTVFRLHRSITALLILNED